VEWDLLKGVPEDRVRELLASSRRRRFARREVLFHAGDPAASVHLVAKGRLAIRVTTPLGDVATLNVVVAGDVLGEMAVLAPGGVRSATAIALEPTETLMIDALAFAELRRSEPQFTEALVELLANRVRQLNERLLEALYVPADTRLLRRVAELAQLYGTDIPLTQEDLAGLAGATRATVNRVLRREEKDGTLVLGRGRVTVVDQQALARRSR
jgi:CRP/FNR family cyclic AMP-dependent transcriptional regulator